MIRVPATAIKEAQRLFNVGLDLLPNDPVKKYPSGHAGWEKGGFTWKIIEGHVKREGALGLLMGVDGREAVDLDSKHWLGDPAELRNSYEQMVEDNAPGLLARLVIAETPSGGRHYVYRCPGVVERNQKLAERPPTDEELAADRKKKAVTLIETRGQNGQIMIAPSLGYTVLQGDLANLPEISTDERSVLLSCARAFNQVAARVITGASTAGRRKATSDERPGDHYNQNGGVDDALELLEAEGWAVVSSRGSTAYLRRPGKSQGVSATYGHIAPGIFYCFTSNGSPFEPSAAYTPFAVRALLKHDGDFKACARELGQKGYGSPLPPIHATERDMTPPAETDAPELPPVVPVAEAEMPPLPASAQLPAELGADACPWLDAYIAFSRKWSPRSYDCFHEACGLWLLSTIAARRVELAMGKLRYPSLFIALCARTSLHAKSSAAEIATDMLTASGLSFLKAPDDSTPQAFIAALTARLSDEFGDLPEEKQQRILQRVAFAAQRGWFFEEFGQKISAMMRDGGFMADFRGLLRRFDDAPPEYEYVTVTRGSDRVERPYLALLANLTPADLRPFAKRGAALWNDGFFARFAFVAPPANQPYRVDRFPQGERTIPDALVRPIQAWHYQLGVPVATPVERLDAKGNPTGSYGLSIETPAPKCCTFGQGVFDAYYRYDEALRVITASNENADMDGSYTRLPEKALRVAMLLASIDNQGRIEMRHWARAQQIAERWRQNLHNLMAQLQEDEPSIERTVEDKIIALLAKNEAPLSARDVSTYIRGLSSAEAVQRLDGMHKAGLVAVTESKRGAKRFQLTEEERKCRHADAQTCRQSVNVSAHCKNDGSADTLEPVCTLSASACLHLPDLHDGEAVNGVCTNGKSASALSALNGSYRSHSDRARNAPIPPLPDTDAAKAAD